MYVTQIQVNDQKGSQQFISLLYARIANCYNLPALETMRKSVDNVVQWPKRECMYEVEYVQSLIKDNDHETYEIRFIPTIGKKSYIIIRLTVAMDGRPYHMEVRFNPHGDRFDGSIIIGYIRLVKELLHMEDVSCVIRGWIEDGYEQAEYVSERGILAFSFDYGKKRYLLGKEYQSCINGS